MALLDLESFSTTSTVAEAAAAIQALIAAVKEMYPVGSIMITYSDSSPASWIGGTWVKIATDSMILGAGGSKAGGATGGKSKHTHLTGIGVNSDGIFMFTDGDDTPEHGGANNNGNVRVLNGSTLNTLIKDMGYSSTPWEKNPDTQVEAYTSETAGMDDYPPFVALYVWRRTA